MQRDSNPVLGIPGRLNSERGARNLEASAPSLLISADARAFICHHRPELVAEFETIDDQARIPIASLLRAAVRPPSEPIIPNSVLIASGSSNSEPTRGIGDLVAAFLHRLGVHAAIGLLQRRGLIGGCQCAARQTRLNALTPRLRAFLEPYLLTLVVVLAWLSFLLLVIGR